MKKCVLGNGYVGSAYKNAGYDCIDRSTLCVSNRAEWLWFYIFDQILKPYDIIINCIGITDTKWTEISEHFHQTFYTNATFVYALSQYCNLANKKLVHISTGDLYGNNFERETNTENSTSLDANTNYRLSKLAGERFCNSNDLILRIRLPFDARNHPKNLLVKSKNYTKFYKWQNCYTYLPDLIKVTDILLKKKQFGIFNIVQPESSTLLNLIQQNTEIQNMNISSIIHSLDNVHVHNAVSITKLLKFYQPMDLEKAWATSWETLQTTVAQKQLSI